MGRVVDEEVGVGRRVDEGVGVGEGVDEGVGVGRGGATERMFWTRMFLVSARRPVMTPFSALEAIKVHASVGVVTPRLRKYAARPATCGVAMEVPERVWVWPLGAKLRMETPGAWRSRAGP